MNYKKTYDMLFNILKYFMSGLLLICFLIYVYLYFKFRGISRVERQSKAFGGVIMFLYFFPAIIVSFIRQLYDFVKNL